MRIDGQPSVPRAITRLVVRSMGMSPVEARRWYRRPNSVFGGQTPEEVASTVEGTRELVAWLETCELAVAGR